MTSPLTNNPPRGRAGLADLIKLSEETAEALLTQIKAQAPRHTGEAMAHLATAYAAVVGAMPGKPVAPRSA